MSVDSITANYQLPVREVSKPTEKGLVSKTKIQEIFNKTETQNPHKTFQELSSLEIKDQSQDVSLTSVTQLEKPIDTTTRDQIETQKIREEILSIPTNQENLPQTNDTKIQISTVEIKSAKSNHKFIEKIKNRYREKQREKIEKYKELIVSDINYSVPDEERVRKEKSPSIVKQFGRIILDTRVAKIIFPRLQENSRFQQELEAENAAAVEYYQERNLSIKIEQQAKEARIEQEKIAEVQRKVKEDQLKQQIEQEKFEQDFLDGMEANRAEKVDNIKKQRAQEIVEKLFNKQLTKLEDIDIDSSIEGLGITKRQFEDVYFYDMKGYQFRFLQHAINYKSDPDLIGLQTAQELTLNPSLWEKSREDVGKIGGQETNSKSNIIATSYINTETNLNTWGERLVCYGFDNILPGSLIQSIGGDGGTSTHIEEGVIKLTTDVNFLGTPEHIEKGDNFYNEVDLKRYDSIGKPKLPRFLIVKNWIYQKSETKEVFLRHAKYFNIPIINIKTEFYNLKK